MSLFGVGGLTEILTCFVVKRIIGLLVFDVKFLTFGEKFNQKIEPKTLIGT